MRLIEKKLFVSKKDIQEFLDENGMEETVKKYGMDKVCKSKVLERFAGTELYHNNFSCEEKVYDKNGKFLGQTTDLMNIFYKDAGKFIGPCENGNIILCRLDDETNDRSYGVFDRNGIELVPYGKFYGRCFLPNGVALINDHEKSKVPVVIVSYAGDVKEKDYTHIKECFVSQTVESDLRSYKIYRYAEGEILRDIIHLNKNGEEVDLDERLDNVTA